MPIRCVSLCLLFLGLSVSGARADFLILESNVVGLDEHKVYSDKELKEKMPAKGGRVRVLSRPDNKIRIFEGSSDVVEGESSTKPIGGTRGMK
jgi:hypothetical protein